jgi:hypothetical protein
MGFRRELLVAVCCAGAKPGIHLRLFPGVAKRIGTGALGTLERHRAAPAHLAPNADGIALRPCGVGLPGDESDRVV